MNLNFFNDMQRLFCEMSINKTLRTIGGLRVITVCLPVGPARKRDSIKL